MKNNPDTTPSGACGEEYRCHCGQLLAKITSAGVELKCKRCKRIELIPWSAAGNG